MQTVTELLVMSHTDICLFVSLLLFLSQHSWRTQTFAEAAVDCLLLGAHITASATASSLVPPSALSSLSVLIYEV